MVMDALEIHAVRRAYHLPFISMSRGKSVPRSAEMDCAAFTACSSLSSRSGLGEEERAGGD